MARSAAQLHADLTAASHKLREVGSADLAEAVDEALTPRGIGALRNKVEAATRPPNLAIRMSATDQARIKAAAAAAGVSLTKVVAEGFDAFLAGTFTPDRMPHATRGSGAAEKVNLNVRVTEAQRARVEEMAQERADELGWTPKPMHVAMAWLLKQYPAPKKPKAAKQ